MDPMRLLHVFEATPYCIRKIRSSVCKVQQTTISCPIQCTLYQGEKTCFLGSLTLKGGGLLACKFHVNLLQQSQELLGLLILFPCWDEQFGPQNI